MTIKKRWIVRHKPVEEQHLVCDSSKMRPFFDGATSSLPLSTSFGPRQSADAIVLHTHVSIDLKRLKPVPDSPYDSLKRCSTFQELGT